MSSATSIDATLPAPTAGTVIGAWNDAGDAIVAGPTVANIAGAESSATAKRKRHLRCRECGNRDNESIEASASADAAAASAAAANVTVASQSEAEAARITQT